MSTSYPAFLGALPPPEEFPGGGPVDGYTHAAWYYAAQAANSAAAAQQIADAIEAQISASIYSFGAVGDGIADDGPAFALAHAWSIATGGEVQLPAGTFLANNVGVVTTAKASKWRGLGGICKVKAGTGSHCFFNLSGASVGFRCLDVQFDGANLSNQGVGSPNGECSVIAMYSGSATAFDIRGNWFRAIPTAAVDHRMHAVQIVAGSGRFIGNESDQCYGDTFNFNAGYFEILGNRASLCGDGGIAMNNDARGPVMGNFVYRCDLGIGCGPEGTTASPDHTLLIEGNEIVGCGDGINMGWYAYVGREGPRNFKVVGNTFDRCYRTGIRYDASAATFVGNGAIVGNTFSAMGDATFGTPGEGRAIIVGCSGVTVTGNTVLDGTGTQIASGNNVTAVAFVANTLIRRAAADLAKTGIGLGAGSSGVCVGNVFSGHTALAINDASGAPRNWTKQGNTLNGAAAGQGLAPSIFAPATETVDLGNGQGTALSIGGATPAQVNYLGVAGQAAGVNPELNALGADTNVGMNVVTKGNGRHRFGNGGSIANLHLEIGGGVTNPANYFRLTGNTATNPPRINAEGSDADIDLQLVPKANGKVRFGTLTVNADAPITGYILVKDDGGTLRKLAVIA